MTIELRAMSAGDWQAWRSVRLAALTEAPDAFGSRLHEWADAPEDRWRARLSISGALDLLAFDTDRDRPVGMASGVPDPDDGTRATLISMWVDPVARGRGVAEALITAITGWAASSGAVALGLSVMPDNIAARRTYARNGFAPSSEPGGLLPDGRRELVMGRDLTGLA
jgi:ribosomal protein S18 acetylase RimI-like enzyme